MKIRFLIAGFLLCFVGAFVSVHAQPEADVPAAEAEVSEPETPLHGRQDAISQRFKRFERLLLQMAEYMRKTDPEQAELLIRAVGQSKQDRISGQMERIVDLLEQDQLGDAIDRETQVIDSLQSLLDLLQSGERRAELQAEQERIKNLIEDLQNTIGVTKDARASNERGDELERAIDRQEIAEASGKKLVDKIDDQDSQRNGKPGESSENKPGEGKEGEASEDENKDGKKPEEGDPESEQGEPKEGESSESKPGEGKPGEQGESQEGKPSEGESKEGEAGSPQEGQPSESESGSESGEQSAQQKKEEKTAGRDEIAQAVERMNRAIEELKKKNRDNASKEQSEAIAKLEEAKAKLEEILRQLREEERELLLAALEARFQKMLAMQIMVYTGTVNLDRTPKDQWSSQHHGRSRELAQTEDEIVLEAVKALDLLKEEGSSVAFPEAIEQTRSDMQTVARRLEQSNAGELTQVIEQDIIESLQELVEALQKEMEKSKEEQEQQQQQQEQQQQDPSLVDNLAELKMLRSLQFRINRRTKVLAREFRGEEADNPDVVDQLHELSRRQARIQQTAYDLATGKNK